MATKSIQQVVLTNFKKHKHLALQIKGDSFLLMGGNGAGKSTVLQAIDHMIGEQLAINSKGEVIKTDIPIPDNAVSDGETDGEIEILLAASGETYRVRRKFTKSKLGRYEMHRDLGNGRFDAILPAKDRFDEIFGNVLDLSPLIDMSGAEQLKLIQAVVAKDGDVSAAIENVKSKVKQLRDVRLETGRSKKDAEAKLLDQDFRALVNYVGEIPTPLAEIEAKYLDVTELNKKLLDISRVNNAADGHIQTLRGIVVKDEEINAGLLSVIALFEAKKQDTTEIEKQIESADDVNKAIDVEMREARDRNAKIEKSKDFANNKQLIADLEKEYKDYTDQIKEHLQSTSAILTQLGLGDIYEGLSLEYVMDEEGKVEKEGLFLRNLPFNRRQQSYGEMVKILIMLSKAFNPDGFNYVKIGDFNLLDEKNQNEVLAIAEANDIQLGIEKVDNGKEIVLQLIER
jgi:DNA repair exonuclease SbcCD ATPase subunit